MKGTIVENYEVVQGDCMSSIALNHGFFWKTLWDRPENSNLSQLRKDPNILLAGDIVVIPDITPKDVPKPSEMKHVFLRKDVPAKLQMQLKQNGKVRDHEAYTIEIDGVSTKGETDANGMLSVPIPPNAKAGKLILKNGAEVHLLDLGHLDPIDTLTGVLARLTNLGLYAGEIVDKLDDAAIAALKNFQKSQSLTESGQIDQPTQDALKKLFGS